MDTMPIWEMFERGGPVMWPLLAASILGVALLLDRGIIFLWHRQSLNRVVKTLRPLVLAGSWAKAEKFCQRRGPYTRTAKIYLEQRDQLPQVREDVLKREGNLFLGFLENRLRWLDQVPESRAAERSPAGSGQ